MCLCTVFTGTHALPVCAIPSRVEVLQFGIDAVSAAIVRRTTDLLC
jgi:hypothetical protein